MYSHNVLTLHTQMNPRRRAASPLWYSVRRRIHVIRPMRRRIHVVHPTTRGLSSLVFREVQDDIATVKLPTQEIIIDTGNIFT